MFAEGGLGEPALELGQHAAAGGLFAVGDACGVGEDTDAAHVAVDRDVETEGDHSGDRQAVLEGAGDKAPQCLDGLFGRVEPMSPGMSLTRARRGCTGLTMMRRDRWRLSPLLSSPADDAGLVR